MDVPSDSLGLDAVWTDLTNWSKSVRSSCLLAKPLSTPEITAAITGAQREGLKVIPRGAGHSYTDAAHNTGGLVLDLRGMRRIRSWDPAQGVMCVEPGVTLGAVVALVEKDGWWPFAAPSTPDVTVGGAVAMNVNGKNAWKYGPFGQHVLALEVLFTSGQTRTILPNEDAELFHALVGGLGLLGVITAVTLQLQRLPGGPAVLVKRQTASSLGEIFALLAAERSASDFVEAWLDGFAEGECLGRGEVTSATYSREPAHAGAQVVRFPTRERVSVSLTKWVGRLGRPFFLPAIPPMNRARYWWGSRSHGPASVWLYSFTFYPPAAFAGYHEVLPRGMEALQAFVPAERAPEVFRELLHVSQRRGHHPVWCIIKEHRRDPFLLSYQVDGFSLELYYPRTSSSAPDPTRMLQQLLPLIIEAGGRFYLAKDDVLTAAQYRESMGNEAVEAFLRLKDRYDPRQLLQSDLYRRVFRPELAAK
jgi:FAD/FMN-containing dehydrogenase